MGGLTMHLPLQLMENYMAKSFSFHSKPSLLHNAIHIIILVCQFMLCKPSSPKKLQRYFSRHENSFGN